MRGDGRIFAKKGTQSFHCAYYLRGKEHRESTNETDPVKAMKFLRSRLKEIHADELGARTFTTPKARRVTIDELLDALKDDFELRGKLSVQNASHLRQAVKCFQGRLAVALTPEQIDAHKKKLLGEGVKPATINRPLQLIRQAFKLAIRRRHLSTPPDFQLLSEKGNERRGFLSEQEFRALLAYLPADLQDLVLFCYVTGTRRGEATSLTWKMLESGELHIPGDICKNRRARTVPISGKLVGIIERRQAARRIDEKATVRMAEYIFHRNGEDGPIGEFKKSWARAAVAAHLGVMICRKCKSEGSALECSKCETPTYYRGRVMHDLRRSAARNMTQAGIPREVAKTLTGHVSDSMWERYNIVITSDARAALEKASEYSEAEAQKKVVTMR
jgi:integrase